METSGPALLNRSSPTTANPDGYGYFIYLFMYLIFYLFIFRERGREGEKHQCVVASGALPPPPPLGTWPTTQACTLTRNWTGYSLVCRPALNPLSHTIQAWLFYFKRRHSAMAGVVQLVGALSCNQKLPGLGMRRRQLISVSLSHE